MIPSITRTYTVGRAATVIGVSAQKIRKLIHAGELPAQWIGNRYLILDTAVEGYLNKIGAPTVAK